MKTSKNLRDSKRRLALRRETLRQMDTLSPDDLARVAGGWSGCCSGNTFSGGSKYC